MLKYNWWKLETASEVCSSSMAEIHDDSSSVLLYPAHLMRYCNFAFVLSVKLGVEDFGDLIFGFIIDVDWRWRWLDAVGDGVQS